MLVRVAEDSFERGKGALERGRGREALAYFEAAIELEKRYGVAQPQARYLSHYGLCLGTTTPRKYEGVQFCREAATLENYNPDLHWNLGRALLAANRRREAYEALKRGLRVQADHAGIIGELRRMGLRKRPPIAFLPRANPLNVFLGRLRAAEVGVNGQRRS